VPCLADPYPAGFLQALTALLGADRVRVVVAAGLDPGVHPLNLGAHCVALPANAMEAAQVLQLCSQMQVGVVPQGGRTGLAGGAVTHAHELIVSLARMQQIEAVAADARTAIVGAGVTLEALDAALKPLSLSAGIDLGARGSATIGGMVATNAGGIDAFRFGTMRERVLGLEVALPTGEVVNHLTRVRKNNAGLPWTQLFVGSEGTLGLITRVALQLVDAPRERYTALVLVADIAGGIAVLRAVQRVKSLRLAAAELMSGNHIQVTARALQIAGLQQTPPLGFGVLVSVENAGAQAAELVAQQLQEALVVAAEAGVVKDAILPKNAAEERDLWRIREDWSVDRLFPGGLWYDVSVPLDALDSYLTALQARIAHHDARLAVYVVGHLADGNLHVTINAATPVTDRYEAIAPLVYDGLQALGGSFSAEHGIGLEKRAGLEDWVGDTSLRLMRSIKAVFDPRGVMNPGKVLRGCTLDPAVPVGATDQ